MALSTEQTSWDTSQIRIEMKPTSLAAILVVLAQRLQARNAKKPDIIVFLTDDEDLDLFRSMKGMRAAQLSGQGATLSGFVTTPLCCPSRASILSGLYAHNHGATNNSRSGGCADGGWRRRVEPRTVAAYMKRLGYATFYAGNLVQVDSSRARAIASLLGKYLNKYGKRDAHKPPGWDWWNGLVGNSVYFNYFLSVNGSLVHYGDRESDYLTTVVREKSLEFLRFHGNSESPIFMMICPPAPHAPFRPEKSHQSNFSTAKAPRSASYDVGGAGKHWIVRQAPHPMTPDVVDIVDDAYRNRKRTLLSVDELVGSVLDELKFIGRLSRSYVIYTSDNGFHTGQFSLPLDKRHLYEFDIRVPLVIRGPGIKSNTSIANQILNIDIAPTILDIAGGRHFGRHMDGKSFAPLILANRRLKRRWRKEFLVEYWGQSSGGVPESCSHRPGLSECHPGCVCEDAANNTYSCIRWERRGAGIFCQFQDDEAFAELYDLRRDPNQLSNLAPSATDAALKALRGQMSKLKGCRGRRCI